MELYILTAALYVLVTGALAATLPSSTPAKTETSPTSPLSDLNKLVEKWMNDLWVAPDYSVFNEATYAPNKDPWHIPDWTGKTDAPWWDTDEDFVSHLNPNNVSPQVDVNVGNFDIPTINFPTMKPIHFDDPPDIPNNNIWPDRNGMGSYTWITMAVVLVVFFKVTVIAVMIVRRMRRSQHRVVIRSANTSSVTVPSEFTSDQAHLVTPANIVYVDTEGSAPPPIPQMFTPPPYCESLLPESGTSPVNPDEDPPPYSG